MIALVPASAEARTQLDRLAPDWERPVTARPRVRAAAVDLTLRVTERYRQLGAARVEALFADARTHTNEAGARLNAACVAEALRALPQAWLTPWLPPLTGAPAP